MNKKYLLMLALASGIVKAGSAQELPLDPAVRTGKLANGFTYYIRHNETPKSRVIFYLANKAGSILETEDQRGLAHFIEHMSFNGTTHFPKNELVNYLQKTGVRFGADLNAYTSFDETVYQLPLPSNDASTISSGLEIMHDWAHGATLDPIEINKERGVILEEKRLGKGATERMQRLYWPKILNNSLYGSRIPIGIDKVLNNFQPQTLKSFYDDWYRPDLQAIIIVGDVNVDEMEKTVKMKFADLKNPLNEKTRPEYHVALTGKNQFITVTDPEMISTTAEIIMKRQALPVKTAVQFRASILDHLFNGMMGKRLTEVRQQANPPFLSASAGLNPFLGGLDSYNVDIAAKPGELENGIKAVWRETEKARRYGFTATELERAKTSYLNQYESALHEQNKTGSEVYIKEYLQTFLTGTASPGIAYEYNLVKADLSGITLTALNTFVKGLKTTIDRDILILAPEKDKTILPGEKEVNAWLSSVESENIQPYVDEVYVRPILSAQPVAGKIIKEDRNETTGITTLWFANGIKVLLKPTQFKNDEVLFTGIAPGGTSIYSDADYQSATAINAIPSFGAGNLDSKQLTKFLSGKQLNVQPYINERMEGVNGSAGTKDLPAALELLYAFFTAPRKDSLIFDGMLARSKAALDNRANDPASVFADSVSAVLSANNVRRTGLSLEKLNQLNINKAYEFYKERFASGGFTFMFVGNIDIEKIKPLLVNYIGGLPVRNKVTPARDLHITIPPGIAQHTVYKGSEPKATVNLVFSGNFDYNMPNRIKMDALKESLQIRLLERLREDESGVYTPSTRISMSKYPQGRFSLTVQFSCAPANTDKLIASALDEIGVLKKQGPPKVNLEKFKAETMRSLESASSTNGFWLTYVSGQLLNDEPIEQMDDYIETLKTLKSADVQETAAKYLKGDNYIRLVLMPETNKLN